MKVKAITFFFSIYGLIFFQLSSQVNSFNQSYLKLYKKAEILFNGAATDSTDSIALTYYKSILTSVTPTSETAGLLYNCYERSGILKQSLGYSPVRILYDYSAALQLKKSFHLGDSILFRLLLSIGNVHYSSALFDSAVFYFSWAEKIINKYPSAGLAGDLYNSLGALYSEAGNYTQGGVYFNKALELTKKNHPELHEAVFAMLANIASSVKLSGNLDSALTLYKKLLSLHQASAAIITNISGIYITKKEADSALRYLSMIKNSTGNYGITTYNEIAQAYMLKHDTAKAYENLQAASALFHLAAQHQKNNYYAATQKYLGDLMMMESKPQQALLFYQQGLIQDDFKFNDTNVFVNPGNYIGEFASYNLFDVLAAKANCFAVIFNNTKEKIYFKTSVSTYDSAFALSDYIKKSIDNDEARLFMADKVFNTYVHAVDFLMAANKTNDEALLVHALQWISKSRATSLIINLKENTIKQYAGIPDSLLQKEKNVKITMSRLKLQLQQSTDTAAQAQLLSAINTSSLQLQSVENSFKTFPDFFKQKFAADNVDIRGIQKNILNNKTAAICYSKGADRLYMFVIRQNQIAEHTTSMDPELKNEINTYTDQLTKNDSGKTYNNQPARFLYTKLMTPLLGDIGNSISLIIIPDENLINIPFEAFESADNKYLIQSFAVTYQYALPLLQADKTKFSIDKAIAFAPFAYNNTNSNMNALPASLDEISSFPKRAQQVSIDATKNKFLNLAANASVIHLATHAVVNFKEPENSYIDFYEKNKTDSSYKIFAHELYNLELPQTQLVFLSACETGAGRLSQSEGALSLSRAFAFAGCPNIVTSLWKAEDNSTAYISKQFYRYVREGYTYAEALQKAKTDLLSEPSMSQFHSPVYWSHLIFIGNVQPEKSSAYLWIISGCFIVIVVLLRFLKNRRW